MSVSNQVYSHFLGNRCVWVLYSNKPKIFLFWKKSFAFRNMISSLLELRMLSTDVPMWLLDVAHASLDFAYLAQQVVCGFEFGLHISFSMYVAYSMPTNTAFPEITLANMHECCMNRYVDEGILIKPPTQPNVSHFLIFRSEIFVQMSSFHFLLPWNYLERTYRN